MKTVHGHSKDHRADLKQFTVKVLSHFYDFVLTVLFYYVNDLFHIRKKAF